MVAMVKSWAVDIIYADEALCLLAGELKAAFRLSFADAFVAATAEQADALLLHKDPDSNPCAAGSDWRRCRSKRGA